MDPIDVLISFDTTGSMYPCLTQVRREVSALVKRLFKDIPGLHVGVIAHGDYIDGPRAISKIPLTDNEAQICDFIRMAPATNGGDAPECYEKVLRDARFFSWRAGKSKVVVLIGDDVPHGPSYHSNVENIDWRNELDLLLEAGINVYGVQCLGHRHARPFYEEIAQKTGGFHLELNQFANIRDFILAICMKQVGNHALEDFEEELAKAGRMNRGIDAAIGTMLGRTASSRFVTAASTLGAVDPGRFQVLDVDKDTPIKDFVTDNGLTFKVGRGFYEFTKPVLVQEKKEVILVDKKSGDLFTGDKARDIAGIPVGTRSRVTPNAPGLRDFVCFIQSTSPNRKLLGGTKFLYEVEGWTAAATAASPIV